MSRDNLRKLKLTRHSFAPKNSMKIMKKKKISKEQIFKKMQELAGPMGDFVTQFSEKMGKNIEERKKRDFMMGIQHVLIDGMAHYDDYDKFLFFPRSSRKGHCSALPRHGSRTAAQRRHLRLRPTATPPCTV